MGDIEKITDEQFASVIAQGVVLADFFADWCGPCRMLSPVLERVAASMQGQVRIVKVDTDRAEKSAASLHITALPTLVLFKDGKEVNRLTGLRDEDNIKAFIKTAL